MELCAEAQAADDSTGKILLADIRQIFEAQDLEKIPSVELACLLCEIETSPWGEWSQGKPLSAAKLARLLKPFAISPHSIRLEDKTPKGYEREDFDDAFTRYLRAPEGTSGLFPRPQSATPQQVNTGAALSAFSKRNSDTDVAALIWPNANVYKPCCGVALSSPSTDVMPGIEEDL